VNARKGDLVAVVTEQRNYVIGSGLRESTAVRLGIVGSATRDGIAKMVRTFNYGTGEPSAAVAVSPRDRVLVVNGVDRDAAVAAYCARRWPTAPHSDSVPPVESVEAMRELLRPFRSAAVAS